MERIKLTSAEWLAMGQELFGDDRLKWKFVCPICKTPQSGEDYIAKGLSIEDCGGSIGFSCIGRKLPIEERQEGILNHKKKKNKPCNYAGGGLFRLNPILVTDEEGEEHEVFEFYRGEK